MLVLDRVSFSYKKINLSSVRFVLQLSKVSMWGLWDRVVRENQHS